MCLYFSQVVWGDEDGVMDGVSDAMDGDNSGKKWIWNLHHSIASQLEDVHLIHNFRISGENPVSNHNSMTQQKSTFRIWVKELWLRWILKF